ncbi:MAG: glycosyltransferase family 4 protein [Myxococcota bacterium]
MRVLALTKYDIKWASARLRFAQFRAPLAEQGIELELSPLLTDDLVGVRLSTLPIRSLLAAIERRLSALARSRRYDALIIHYELFPYAPALFEGLLSALRIPYLVDYDDAIFHQYDHNDNALVRWLLSDKIAQVIQRARAVFAGSHYLEDYARQHNPRVVFVPTVIDVNRYGRIDPSRPRSADLSLAWVGSPSTSEYLSLVAPALERFGREKKLRFIVTGGKPIQIPGVEVEVRRWSEETEVRDLLECDAGIMPLPDTPWARGKCAFKLIQYMGCAMPVIASPVGANRDVVRDGVEGLWATDEEAWVQALRTLEADPGLRAKMGAAGRARVEEHYSVEAVLPRIADTLKNL